MPGNKACAASFRIFCVPYGIPWNTWSAVSPLYTVALQSRTTLHSTSQTLTNGSLLHITLTWDFIWNTLDSCKLDGQLMFSHVDMYNLMPIFPDIILLIVSRKECTPTLFPANVMEAGKKTASGYTNHPASFI